MPMSGNRNRTGIGPDMGKVSVSESEPKILVSRTPVGYICNIDFDFDTDLNINISGVCDTRIFGSGSDTDFLPMSGPIPVRFRFPDMCTLRFWFRFWPFLVDSDSYIDSALMEENHSVPNFLLSEGIPRVIFSSSMNRSKYLDSINHLKLLS